MRKVVMKKIFISLLFFVCVQAENTWTPKISIITSVYDGDDFIEHFLEDITKQTIFGECELFLINANSPGNEEAIIKPYLEKYSNIIYVRLEKDPGLFGVWNLGIEMARADFITNANVDDRFAYNWYETAVKNLEKHLEIDLVYADYYITGKKNETVACNSAPSRVISPQFSVQNMKLCLPNFYPVWRKSMHEKHGLFDATYISVGDYDMWLRAVEGGARFMKINGVYGLFYNAGQGLSTGKRAPEVREERKRLNELYKHMFSEGRSDKGKVVRLNK